jgi:5-methylcytosine-specific restriction endonuclease McrA
MTKKEKDNPYEVISIKEEKVIYNYNHNRIHLFRETLLEEFQNRCAYCNSKLGLTSPPEIDQFYPKSIYPKRANQLENLLLCCSVCNRNKANSFPVDKDGLPLLLNPRFDNFADHIKIEKDGKATAITERGKTTIEILKLNRNALVEERKIQQLERDYLFNYTQISDKYFSNFKENIRNIRELNTFSELTKDKVKEHLRNMLFANVITSLETYLSDAFINTVKSNKLFLRKFVETFHNFRNEKFEVRELFIYYDSIDERATKAMLDVIYHDLPKVKGMYSDTLGIELTDLSLIYKAVLKRHDFVHRNGKTKDGEKHIIEIKDIEDLCKLVEVFVENIDKQIQALKSNKK